MTPTTAIIELSALDLMKLVEGVEVRVGIVAIRPGEQSTCSIIGTQEPTHAPGRREPAFPEPTPSTTSNASGRKVVTTLRFVRFPKPCALCRETVPSGTRAKWCPQTKDIFHERHDDDACLAVVLA